MDGMDWVHRFDPAASRAGVGAGPPNEALAQRLQYVLIIGSEFGRRPEWAGRAKRPMAVHQPAIEEKKGGYGSANPRPNPPGQDLGPARHRSRQRRYRSASCPPSSVARSGRLAWPARSL